MIERRTLLKHLDTILQTAKFRDYCPNGLQVEGHEHIGHIVTGVTASQALVDAAIERGLTPFWYTMVISGKAKTSALPVLNANV